MGEGYTLLMISAPVVLPTFSRKPFPDCSLESGFLCALHVKAGHLPVTSVSVSIVRVQNHSVKGSLVPKKEHCTKVLGPNSDPTT